MPHQLRWYARCAALLACMLVVAFTARAADYSRVSTIELQRRKAQLDTDLKENAKIIWTNTHSEAQNFVKFLVEPFKNVNPTFKGLINFAEFTTESAEARYSFKLGEPARGAESLSGAIKAVAGIPGSPLKVLETPAVVLKGSLAAQRYAREGQTGKAILELIDAGRDGAKEGIPGLKYLSPVKPLTFTVMGEIDRVKATATARELVVERGRIQQELDRRAIISAVRGDTQVSSPLNVVKVLSAPAPGTQGSSISLGSFTRPEPNYPSSLTPEGQQARLRNEKIVADETLKASVQSSRNDSSLRVEAITDPILPTKIVILNPPAPTEMGLQNPLSSSPQISLPPTPTTAPVQQPGNATSEPPVGGIRFGPQQYTEKKGLEGQAEKERGNAQVMPRKK